MNSFYTLEELKEIGFRSIGGYQDLEDANEPIEVWISRKASIYSPEQITIGNHVRIDDFCILSGYIEIGNHIHIAAYSALYGGTDGIFLDDYANISSRVTIYSVNDDYSGRTMTGPMIPEQYKGGVSAPVRIGKHVIVGSTSVILPGITLREGSSFGSFSFINRDSEAWSMNVGIPFQRIRDREKGLLELEKQFRSNK